jgi:hypothetical protein
MDERKKKMLMIGGVVALAVVVIIVAAVMMDHKKKVEQSPMIVHTTTGPIIVPANTPVSTVPTTGTTQGITTQGITTQGITTQGITTQGITTQGITTPLTPKKTYLVSAGYYLVFKNGQPLAGTNKLSEATPISTSNYKIPGNDQVFTVLKTEDGSSFITTNSVPTQSTILYTDDVKLNYVAPFGVATLILVKQPDGYFVQTLGGSRYAEWGVWAANTPPTYNFAAYANTFQLVTM